MLRRLSAAVPRPCRDAAATVASATEEAVADHSGPFGVRRFLPRRMSSSSHLVQKTLFWTGRSWVPWEAPSLSVHRHPMPLPVPAAAKRPAGARQHCAPLFPSPLRGWRSCFEPERVVVSRFLFCWARATWRLPPAHRWIARRPLQTLLPWMGACCLQSTHRGESVACPAPRRFSVLQSTYDGGREFLYLAQGVDTKSAARVTREVSVGRRSFFLSARRSCRDSSGAVTVTAPRPSPT